MKKNWHLFGIGFSIIFSTVFWKQSISAPHEKLTSLSSQFAEDDFNKPAKITQPAVKKIDTGLRAAYKKQLNLADSVITLGMNRIGTPYKVAGISDAGFDCSGFVSYIFDKIGVAIPHSSAMLAETGTFIPRQNARKGDILIFTGTNMQDRTPGHVGVVISNPGEVLSFVHSSSNGGVKISQVETTNYEKRFLEVRRVL